MYSAFLDTKTLYNKTKYRNENNISVKGYNCNVLSGHMTHLHKGRPI